MNQGNSIQGYSPSPSIAKLCAALVVAQGKASAVEKTSKNAHHNYSYAGAEALIEEARAALSSSELAIVPTSSILDEKGDVLHSSYLLVHASGESMGLKYETPVIPDKGRPMDKAVATARTYALGYMLRDLLLLPRVEPGADVDSRDDRGHEPKRRTMADPIDALPPEHVARELRAKFATNETKADTIATWKEVGVAFKSKQLNGELLDALTLHRDASAQRVRESEKREPGEEG